MPEPKSGKKRGGGMPNNTADERLSLQRAQRDAEKHDTTSYMTEKQREKIEAIEKRIVNYQNEKAIVVGEHGEEMVRSKRGDSGTAWLNMKSYENYSNAVLTHNHPNGEKNGTLTRRIGVSFSDVDLVRAADYNLKGIRARTGDYLYSFTRGSKGWGKSSDIRKAYSEAFNKAIEHYTGLKGFNFNKGINGADTDRVFSYYAKKQGIKIMTKQGEERAITQYNRTMAIALHQANKAVAKQFGLKYTRKKVK